MSFHKIGSSNKDFQMNTCNMAFLLRTDKHHFLDDIRFLDPLFVMAQLMETAQLWDLP